MTTTTDDDDVTRIQPAAVRDFNQQLAEAYMNPQDYDRYGAANERLLRTGAGETIPVYVDQPPLPPETTTPLPDDPLQVPPGTGSSTPGTPPAPALSPAGARPRRAQHDPFPAVHRRTWRWLLSLVTLVGVLMLGIWAGSGTNPVQPIGAPVAAVTVTAEPQPEIRAVTPKACIDALRAADQAFDIVFNTLSDIGEQNKADAKAAKAEYRRQLEPVGRTYWKKRDICYTSR